jgi:aspartyl/glutamyl-tRNA(asn/gln) amidotransferase, C subunit
MDKLTKEEVNHIAHLARIGMSDSDVETFQIELKKLLDEVSKITDIKGYDDEIMFTPSENKAALREDIEGEMLSAKEALANAPKKNGNFVEVPVMINE